MSIDIVYQKASWTIPSDILESVHARVPRGQVSAYVTEALRRVWHESIPGPTTLGRPAWEA